MVLAASSPRRDDNFFDVSPNDDEPDDPERDANDFADEEASDPGVEAIWTVAFDEILSEIDEN